MIDDRSIIDNDILVMQKYKTRDDDKIMAFNKVEYKNRNDSKENKIKKVVTIQKKKNGWIERIKEIKKNETVVNM